MDSFACYICGSFKVDRTYNLDKLLSDNTGTYEIEMTIKNRNAEIVGFQLFNSKGEEVDIYYNLVEKKFAMDRSKSGIVSFSQDFPIVTFAPIYNRISFYAKGGSYTVSSFKVYKLK